MVAVFYDAPVLRSMVQDVILRRLSATRLEIPELCELAAWFRRVSVVRAAVPGGRGPDPEALERAIPAGLAALKKSQEIFCEQIVSRLSELLQRHRGILLASLTPSLLARVLEKHGGSNVETAEVIERYVAQASEGEITEEDRSRFNAIINWDDPRLYRLFSRFDLPWADPVRARECLRLLREKRADTIAALEDRAGGLAVAAVSRWFASSWLKGVDDSDGFRSDPHVELCEFLGTVGAGVRVDPIKLGYLCDRSTPSLGAAAIDDDGLGSRLLFNFTLSEEERADRHFVSQPVPQPEIGLELVGCHFVPTFVNFSYDPGELRHYHAPDRIALKLWDEKVERPCYSVESRVQHGQARFLIEEQVPFVVLKLVMLGNEKRKVLRADSIHIHGFFLPDAL
jgi:hypothetical protein